MSIKAVNWALNDVQCQPDFKVILIAMGERADDHGFCFPTQAELSKKTCIPLRTLKRKVQQLLDFDVLTKVTKQVEKNLRRNSYRLHLEREFNLLDKRTVVANHNSAKLAPLSEAAESQDSANVAPLIVPERHHSEQQWCHPDGTQNGATHVAYKPSLNHHSNNNNCSSITTEPVHDAFNAQPSDRRSQITISQSWRPSPHVFDQLWFNKAIPKDFVDEQLPGFVIYHDQARGRHSSFDAKFHSHVIHNWEKSKTDPRPISASWKPDNQTVWELRKAGVPEDYIDERAIEFVMYWLESGVPAAGWNAKFFNAVLTVWNRAVGQSHAATAGALAVRQSTAENALARTIEKLTDRSWAEG